MTFELDCYRLDQAVPISPARRSRDIFDRNPWAYKCLPLSIANSAGWELLNPTGFTATWDGGDGKDAITVEYDDPGAPLRPAKSHFAFGILTFDTGWLFRTSAGFGLWVMGSPNDPKDGLSPLTGLVETDWLPYPFTMNWQFTRPGSVRFEQGEPFGFITPGVIQPIADCQPRELALADNPELATQLAAWTTEREDLMARRRAAAEASDPDAKWGRRYFRGEAPPGAPPPPEGVHVHKMRTRAPIPSPAAQAATQQSVPLGLDSAGNVIGRAPRLILSAPEAGGDRHGLVMMDDFVSPADCATLCALYDGLRDHYSDAERDEFWRGRMLRYAEVAAHAPDAAALMAKTMARAIAAIEERVKPPSALYPDTLNLVGWRPEMHMPVHADDAYEVDGGRPLAHRAFGGVLYLNDDYEGGGLLFPRQNALILPRAGTLLAFPGGSSHEHGVTRVLAGRRVTMPFFLTLDRTKAAPDLASYLDAQKPRLLFGVEVLGGFSFSKTGAPA